MSDYASYLRVTDDGHIWWPLQDAIRLAAGFRPYVDDRATLEPELRAPNKKTKANERTLLGAFSDTRLNIAKPATMERDGFYFVDAAGFLDWLSQYICLTQAAIAFPSELVIAVRKALGTAEIERSHRPPKAFESLTLALENRFDKSLDELPDALRCRVEQELPQLRGVWNTLSPSERRCAVLDYDFQHDPAALKQREFWFDFFARQKELQEQIESWERTATPTAMDKLQQKSRLKALRDELARMDTQQRHARGDYFPQPKQMAEPCTPPVADDFIAYPKAIKLLAERQSATPEELAAWIFLGPDTGGIAAYLNANELADPPRFHFNSFMSDDYIAPMMACWFRRADVERFAPEERYMAGNVLIEQWGKLHGIRAESFIRAKIAESRLLDLHPIFGGTQGSIPEENGYPPLSAGLFPVSQVRRIEIEDLCDGGTSSDVRPQVGSLEWRRQNASAAANAKHDKAGGSRDKQQQIRDIWAVVTRWRGDCLDSDSRQRGLPDAELPRSQSRRRLADIRLPGFSGLDSLPAGRPSRVVSLPCARLRPAGGCALRRYYFCLPSLPPTRLRQPARAVGRSRDTPRREDSATAGVGGRHSQRLRR